jgi:SAM-dependent methyltransferase
MIIDIGCGSGSVTWWLQQNGFMNAEGIDISSEQIEEGRRLGVNNIKQADAVEYLKDRQDFYDVIFLRDFLEHFHKDEIIELLDICRKSLKDKGCLIIQTPNAESPFFGRIRYGDLTHEIAFSVSSLSQLLRGAGFNEVQFSSYEPIIVGIKSIIRFLLWKIIEAFYKTLLSIEIGRGKRIVTQNIIAIGIK